MKKRMFKKMQKNAFYEWCVLFCLQHMEEEFRKWERRRNHLKNLKPRLERLNFYNAKLGQKKYKPRFELFKVGTL